MNNFSSSFRQNVGRHFSLILSSLLFKLIGFPVTFTYIEMWILQGITVLFKFKLYEFVTGNIFFALNFDNIEVCEKKYSYISDIVMQQFDNALTRHV